MVLGNFINATHGSSAGTFDKRTFLTRSHLEPTMGPPKALTISQVNHEDPDIADYLEGQIWLNKMMQVTASPFQNTLRSIPKKRAPAKTIEFPENSAALQHLLSIQGLDTEEVRKSKEEFLEGKKTLAEDFQSFSKEEDEALWKLQQEKEAKEMKNKVNNIKQKGATKHLQKKKQQNQQTNEPASWGDWDITNIKVKDISQENKAYKEYKLKNSIKTVGEGLRRKNKIKNKKQKEKPKKSKITWGETVCVEFTLPDEEGEEEENKSKQTKCFWTEYQNNLFETSEDAQLYKIIEFGQEVATA